MDVPPRDPHDGAGARGASRAAAGSGRDRSVARGGRSLLRCALGARCPNCVLGGLFDGPWRPRPRCALCGMAFDPDGSNGLAVGFFLVTIVLHALLLEGIALYLAFGLFPGLAWVLGVSSVAAVIGAWRATRGAWVWCLWRMGMLGPA